MPFFQNDGINFYYEKEGRGFPFLFLHGLGGSIDANKYLIEEITDMEKIYVDMRGHGRTHPLGTVENLNFRQFSKDTRNLINHLGISKLIIGGISMGAAVSIRFTLDFPEMVKGLILIRPAWLNCKNPKNLNYFKMIINLLEKYSPEEAIKYLIDNPDYQDLERKYPAVARTLADQILSENAKDYYYRLISLPNSIPYEDPHELSKITIKTLIIGTELDPIHPFSIARQLTKNIHDSSLYEVVSKSENIDLHVSQIQKLIEKYLSEIGIYNK